MMICMKICIISINKEKSIVADQYLATFQPEKIDYYIPALTDISSIQKKIYDLIIFDGLSEVDDVRDTAFVRSLRHAKKMVPIFLVTGVNVAPSYREHMLDNGIDGCVQVPFSKEEFLLRVGKLLRKKDTLLFEGTCIDAEDISIDISKHVVKKNGEAIHVTKTEYSILFHLFLHKNIPIPNKVLSLCLGREIQDSSSAVNLHILNLRKKLGRGDIIKTIPHYGFSV